MMIRFFFRNSVPVWITAKGNFLQKRLKNIMVMSLLTQKLNTIRNTYFNCHEIKNSSDNVIHTMRPNHEAMNIF